MNSSSELYLINIQVGIVYDIAARMTEVSEPCYIYLLPYSTQNYLKFELRCLTFALAAKVIDCVSFL